MTLQQVAEQLQKNGFSAMVLPDAAAAKRKALELIGTGSVGFGGSVTTQTLGLYDTLKDAGNAVYWHWKATPEEVPATLERAAKADFYVSSSNAITHTGALVNTDGRGNRVSSLCNGPRKVIVIAGRNKIVPDIPAAISRIKNIAAPLNARRIGLKTPCAVTGKCTDCHSAQRMCNVTSIMEAPTSPTEVFHVLLVDEDLGF